MIVVISKDDYGTPVVFVECWGSPRWWCWWVDVSEKPTKRRGRTKKLRREEMLMKENVKFKIGKRGYEKWKVQLRSKELPEHAAQGPVTASKRPTPSLSQASARKQPRRWVVWHDDNMILLSNTFQVIVSSPRHGQHQPAASVGHQGQSQDAAEVGGWAALLVHARPRRQEAVQVRVGAQVFQSVTSCLEPNTADRRASQRMRMRPTLRLLDRPWWRSRGPRPHPSCRWPGPRCSSPWPRRETMPTDDVVNEIIYVTILMNFLIHELNKFTSIESPSQYFFIL